MPDRKPPADVDQLLTLAKHILQNFEPGRSTVVHCVGGIGRSGLVALSVLIHHGYEVEEAIEYVTEKRGRKAPDTESQLAWFKENAAKLKLAK